MKIAHCIFLSSLSLIAFLMMPTLVMALPLKQVQPADTLRPAIARSETQQEDAVPNALYPESAYFLEQVTAARQSEEEWRLVVQQEPKNAKAYQNIADALRDLSRFQEADTFYRRAIEVEPTNETPYLAYGEFLLSQSRVSDAVALYQKATEMVPDSAIAHLKLALSIDNIYTGNPYSDPARAEAAYREVLRLDPNEMFAYQMLGEHLKRSNRVTEAEEIFHTALRLDPEDYSIYENIAEMAEERGDLSAAKAVYKEAIAANPRNLETHRRFSSWLFKHDQSSEAEASYREALKQFPEDEGLYDRFASYLFQGGQIEEAEALLNEAIAHGIEKSFIYSHLGIVLSEKGQSAEAEAALRKAVLLSPDTNTYFELATFLQEIDRTEDAIVICQQAISSLAQNESLYYKLGRLYLENGQVEAAIATYQEAFQVHGTSDSAMSLAEVLLEQGQYAEAEAIYRQHVRSYDSSSLNVQRWKRALIALGKEEDANNLEQYLNGRLAANWTATYQEAVRISPESGYYHSLLGDSLMEQRQMVVAEAAYREALRLGYSAFLTTVQIGKTLFDQGLIEKAEATYEAAFALEPEPDDYDLFSLEFSELYQNMGELRQAQGDLYSALDFYRKALWIDPYTEGISEKVHELLALISESKGVVKNRVTLWSDQVVSELVVIPPFSAIAPI